MHPTSFRPFVPQIQSLTYLLIAPTPSNLDTGNDPTFTSAHVSERARHLLVLLHVSGPKNAAGVEWAKSLDALIITVQRTGDKVFRSLIEDWTPSPGNFDTATSDFVEDVVSDQKPAPLALPSWTGIHAGIERLDGLLQTLQAFLASATATAVTLPVGSILNLVDRVLSILPPGDGRNPRVKAEIGRDEREGLWVGLPRLQIAAIGLCSLTISRLSHSCAAVASTIMEQLLWTFESQCGHDGFRKAAYGLVSQIITSFGPSLPKIHAISLSRCIRMCCEDLLPSVQSQLQSGQASFPDTKKHPNGITSTNADSYLKSTISELDLSSASVSVLQAARELLPLTLMNLPNDYLPFSLRCHIDRTAIITNNRKAMLASVINPTSKRKGQKQQSSILPLLARAHPEALEIEALLRPQMPPIQTRRNDGREMESDEEEDIYMHSHTQTRESDRCYEDSVLNNGEVNMEPNFITVQHSDVQADATPGAVEEGVQSTEPIGVSEITATDFPEPKPFLSYNPMKRERDEDSDLKTRGETRGVVEGDSTELDEIGVPSKRSRMGYDETQKESLPELAPADPAILNSGGQAVKNISASDSATVSDRRPILQQENSDESDFEMPILNLDPDTDEEEEEEEEEDDDD